MRKVKALHEWNRFGTLETLCGREVNYSNWIYVLITENNIIEGLYLSHYNIIEFVFKSL